MDRIKVSIVMTTYNGSEYIVNQLDSLRNQTMKADQVVICDDCSTDTTVEVIREYIEQNSLTNWFIKVNQENIGWKKNFFKAASLSTGDIVFFSDQDDEWLPNKVELLSNLLISNNADVAYGGSVIIDEKSLPVEGANTKHKWTKKTSVLSFTKKFNTIITLGCRMCVSRRIINQYLQLEEPDSGHDTQCSRIALLSGTVVTVDTPVIKYRIHNNNTSGVSNEGSYGYSSLERRISDIEQNIIWLNKTIKMFDVSKETTDTIVEIIDMQNWRLKYLTRCKGVSIFNLLKYLPFYSGIGMLIGDYSYRHGVNKRIGDIRLKLQKAINR